MDYDQKLLNWKLIKESEENATEEQMKQKQKFISLPQKKEEGENISL